MSAPARLIRTAADILERDGWCQGQYTSPSGARCIEQALSTAWRQLGMDMLQKWDAELALDRKLGTPIHWNDRPGRTADEVITTLRNIADELSDADSGGKS